MLDKDDPGKPIEVRSQQVVDNGTAPTILFDGIHGISLLESNVVFNITRTTMGTPGGQMPEGYIDTVARLSIPLSAFARVAQFLHDHYDRMRAQGLAPDLAPVPEEKDGSS